MRILLIDDDAEIRFLAGFVLRQAGHAMTEADSGAQGLRAATGGAFDLIVLDYRLGDTDGESLLRELRRAGVDAPVAFLTGRDDEETARSLSAAGAVDIIAKPFDPEALAARLEAAATGSGAGG